MTYAKWMLALGAGGLFVSIGCEHDHPRRREVVIEERRPVEREEIVVEEAPPPVRVEVRPVAPGPRHVWIPGYYGYENRHYVWISGRWAERPHERSVWVRDEWVRTPHGWRRVPGHWS